MRNTVLVAAGALKRKHLLDLVVVDRDATERPVAGVTPAVTIPATR